MAFDRRVAAGDLRLAHVEALEILMQHEQVVGLIVAGQGGDELGLGRAAPGVAMLGEVLGSPLPRDDVAQNAQPRGPRDIAHDER